MQEYKHRFEEDLLAECPYDLCQEDACTPPAGGVEDAEDILRRDASKRWSTCPF
ncbi:hypothetical protein TIFTF001_031231 [Ficus carica]|uniref:Uncharacterized protein n=1 Tax=Ficus carica TaxID=3494 RepID=A0AA88E0M2_FICCA|nr:hypothetical protein TIFTF001_031231 [Ficus carica]